MVFAVLSALMLAVAPAAAQKPELLAHWVQMAPGGAAEMRVVVKANSCPLARLDGQRVPMLLRAAPDDKFPVRVCALTLRKSLKQLSVLGELLPVPKQVPQRILVLGDTGCRIKDEAVQACNDPQAWPFPSVALQAAKLKPDLVVHVGDYLYRESACPPGNAGCAGSPWGDNWASWAADFFTPAAPLLAAAPWVIVRGNHEECPRAGPGFLRLLGPLAHVEGAPCVAHVAPYDVALGGINLVVMDNADAVDRGADDALVRTYQGDFAALSKLASGPSWLAMHHPIWGVVRVKLGMVVGGNTTLESAEDEAGLPASVALMLAGHIHTFEAINYAGNLPPQLIVGEGGDTLADAPPDLSGQTIGTAKIADGFSLPGWGFLLMTREAQDRWHVDVYDAAGARERSCTIAARRIDCPKG